MTRGSAAERKKCIEDRGRGSRHLVGLRQHDPRLVWRDKDFKDFGS